jgi:hypothetical protein
LRCADTATDFHLGSFRMLHLRHYSLRTEQASLVRSAGSEHGEGLLLAESAYARLRSTRTPDGYG